MKIKKLKEITAIKIVIDLFSKNAEFIDSEMKKEESITVSDDVRARVNRITGSESVRMSNAVKRVQSRIDCALLRPRRITSLNASYNVNDSDYDVMKSFCN